MINWFSPIVKKQKKKQKKQKKKKKNPKNSPFCIMWLFMHKHCKIRSAPPQKHIYLSLQNVTCLCIYISWNVIWVQNPAILLERLGVHSNEGTLKYYLFLQHTWFIWDQLVWVLELNAIKKYVRPWENWIDLWIWSFSNVRRKVQKLRNNTF